MQEKKERKKKVQKKAAGLKETATDTGERAVPRPQAQSNNEKKRKSKAKRPRDEEVKVRTMHAMMNRQ